MTILSASELVSSERTKLCDLAAACQFSHAVSHPGILSDSAIAVALLSEELEIEGRRLAIQPASLDLHLSSDFQEPRVTYAFGPTWGPTPDQWRPAKVRGKGDDEKCRHLFTKDAVLANWKGAPVTDAELYLVLKAGAFVLACTEERVRLAPSLRGQIRGKSRYDRLGISVTNGGGYVDPGYSGQLTLFIKNNGNRIQVIPVGVPICQIELSRLGTPAARPYGHPSLASSYQGSTGATPAK